MKDYTLLVYFSACFILKFIIIFSIQCEYSPGCAVISLEVFLFFNTDKTNKKDRQSHKLYFKDMRDQWKLRKLDEVKFHRGDNHSEVIDG